MRNDLSFDKVAFGHFVDDDLIELLVLLEEEVAVSEADAARRLRRQHIQTPLASQDLKGPTSVFSAALEMTLLVDLGLAFGLLWQRDLVFDDVHHVSLLVDRDLRDV
jgi:hypothetical protein